MNIARRHAAAPLLIGTIILPAANDDAHGSPLRSASGLSGARLLLGDDSSFGLGLSPASRIRPHQRPIPGDGARDDGGELAPVVFELGFKIDNARSAHTQFRAVGGELLR